FAVIAVHHFTALVFRYDRQAVGLMAQENVTDLFHQSRLGSRWTMVWIEYHQLQSVWQGTRATGPGLVPWSKQVFASCVAESLDFLEVEHDEICEPGEVKGIEGKVRPHAGEVAQRHGFQF